VSNHRTGLTFRTSQRQFLGNIRAAPGSGNGGGFTLESTRCTKVTAPSRALARAPGLDWRSCASMIREKICSTAPGPRRRAALGGNADLGGRHPCPSMGCLDVVLWPFSYRHRTSRGSPTSAALGMRIRTQHSPAGSGRARFSSAGRGDGQRYPHLAERGPRPCSFGTGYASAGGPMTARSSPGAQASPACSGIGAC